MPKKTAGMLALATALGIVIGATGNQAISSGKPQIARTELINVDLADLPGKIARMYTVELAPGLMTPRHSHPGHYFTYVLEGSGIVEEDGKPTLHLNPGVTYYIHTLSVKPDSWHSVWNTSQTQPLKTLVVLINDKGQPGTVFEK
jgi:quercetin dioxygenase-like cupin family protein